MIQDRLTQLEKIFNDFNMIGQDGITTHGDLHRGYAVHTPDTSGGVGSTGPTGSTGFPPVTPTGACCDAMGNCTIDTQSHCESGGGDYQGDGTPCDPNPCPPTGACCVGSDCSITTEADCMGTYQGDGTPCDPNPCVLPDCPCSFTDANLPGRYFMRRDRNGFLNLSEAICFDGSAETNNQTFTGAYEEYDSDCNLTSVNGNRHVVHRICNGTVFTSDLPYNFSTSLGCGFCAVTTSSTTVSGTTVTTICHSDNTSGDDCHQVGEDNIAYSEECTPV